MGKKCHWGRSGWGNVTLKKKTFSLSTKRGGGTAQKTRGKRILGKRKPSGNGGGGEIGERSSQRGLTDQ